MHALPLSRPSRLASAAFAAFLFAAAPSRAATGDLLARLTFHRHDTGPFPFGDATATEP